MARVKVGARKQESMDSLKLSIDSMFEQLLKMVDLSMVLLDENSNDVASSIIDEDQYLDQMHMDIIVEVGHLIIREQPKAADLRLTLASYSVAGEIERVGDYFKSFAKMMLKSDIDERKHQKLVSNMFVELRSRVIDTKEAYKTNNHELAKSIARRDQDIDDICAKLTLDVNSLLEQPLEYNEVKAYTRILGLARTLERAGDHLVNICEQVSYIEKGQVYHYS